MEVQHPFEPASQDLVVVEVVHREGVKEDGKVYKFGKTLTLARGHAEAQNKPDRPVYRILKTVRYAKDPEPDASYEQRTVPGPLNIS